MAWNEPGNNGNKDPWGNRNKNDGPPDLEEMFKKFAGFFGGTGSGSGGAASKGAGSKMFTLVAVVVAAIWAVSGFYTVNEAEKGVVLHFGKYDRTVEAGINWLPKGIEKVIKVNIDKMRDTSVSGIMLTKDINIVEVDVGIQYQVNLPQDYLFNLADVETTLNQAAESAMRQVVGNTLVDAILTTDKERIQTELKIELDLILAQYNSGLSIRTVTLERVRPPREVNEAFEEVNRAAQDAKKLQQEADAYQNQKLPFAIADAEKARQQADGYRATALARANGEIARFKQLLPQYQAAPEVTRTRLYLETVEEVMSNASKVMIDTEGGNNMIYIPLDQIMKNKSEAK